MVPATSEKLRMILVPGELVQQGRYESRKAGIHFPKHEGHG